MTGRKVQRRVNVVVRVIADVLALAAFVAGYLLARHVLGVPEIPAVGAAIVFALNGPTGLMWTYRPEESR